jgi:organic radical activating enzyme
MFYSIQGEGRYVGVPSVFLRVFGCNFECTGFGQPRDKEQWVSEELMPHNKSYSDISEIKDLPVPHIGCDSSFSWGKKWGHLADYDDVDTIVDKINSYIPGTEPIHLVITGGEPLLKGFQSAMSDIVLHKKLRINNITFETNGTQEYFFNDLVETHPNRYQLYCERLGKSTLIRLPNGITWSVSPKLSISGEEWKDAIVPDALLSYNTWPDSFLILKFVVRDKYDLQEVEEAIMTYKDAGVRIDSIYLMPEGGTLEEVSYTEKDVVQLCLDTGYKFSPRLHINLFGNVWGT